MASSLTRSRCDERKHIKHERARAFLAAANIGIGQAFEALQPAQLAAVQAEADRHRQIKYNSPKAVARPELVLRRYERLR